MTDSYNNNLHKEAIGKLYQYGKELRKAATPAEQLLWDRVRNRRLNGLKFRRQHPIDKFVVDFYCHEKKLVIELDGGIHGIKINKEYDEARTAMLAGLTIYVLRFRNEEVWNEIENVVMKICETAEMLG